MKGRYDEHVYEDPADMGKLNELSRSQYHKEVGAIVDALNRQIPEEQPKLRLPDPKFNRNIGEYAGETYSVEGEPLSAEEYEKHLEEVMPTDSCQFFYECSHCHARLKAKEGDCCVFCSYGSVKCPPKQEEKE